LRCGFESARLYFKTRAQSAGAVGKGSRGVYVYRAGRYLPLKGLILLLINLFRWYSLFNGNGTCC